MLGSHGELDVKQGEKGLCCPWFQMKDKQTQNFPNSVAACVQPPHNDFLSGKAYGAEKMTQEREYLVDFGISNY